MNMMTLSMTDTVTPSVLGYKTLTSSPIIASNFPAVNAIPADSNKARLI